MGHTHAWRTVSSTDHVLTLQAYTDIFADNATSASAAASAVGYTLALALQNSYQGCDLSPALRAEQGSGVNVLDMDQVFFNQSAIRCGWYVCSICMPTCAIGCGVLSGVVCVRHMHAYVFACSMWGRGSGIGDRRALGQYGRIAAASPASRPPLAYLSIHPHTPSAIRARHNNNIT